MLRGDLVGCKPRLHGARNLYATTRKFGKLLYIRYFLHYWSLSARAHIDCKVTKLFDTFALGCKVNFMGMHISVAAILKKCKKW